VLTLSSCRRALSQITDDEVLSDTQIPEPHRLHELIGVGYNARTRTFYSNYKALMEGKYVRTHKTFDLNLSTIR
jgi:hypothetical protein